MKINKIPVRTWNHLRMNDYEADPGIGHDEFEYKEEIPEGVGVFDVSDFAKANINPGIPERLKNVGKVPLRTGFGNEFDQKLGSALSDDIRIVYFKKNSENTPVYQDFNLSKQGSYTKVFHYEIEEGAKACAIQFVTSKDAGDSEVMVQSRYHISKGAEFTLIQVQMLENTCIFYNDIGGEVEDEGSFNLIQLILGGKKNAYGAFNELGGKKSCFNVDLAYELEGTESLDMNYVANHNGRLSESNMNVSGVLKGEAKKLFRGTIDFHRGCAGAKGAELEDVLILDDECINQTIPLILCDEEDVEGAHGASIGKPDEKIVFYMKSRGLSEEEIYRMIARSKIAAVEGKITDERTLNRLGREE
ncbi:MAG: SufD family Fe-S cluster assembly protein [Lachnospiraceae bacterium]|nr:SufD family Fe-S cluster assembly protein [Lachnospiraceae bacterium]